MKKLYIALSLFLASFAYSQVPQAFTYQTIAFNSAGAPIANGNVNLRISILDNSATGTVLYTETHTKTTNSKGLVNLNIGQGTATTGNFGGINWGTNTKFVKVEMDPAGGSNYTNVGVNQLMSVPYALVAGNISSNSIIGSVESDNGATGILTTTNAYAFGSYTSGTTTSNSWYSQSISGTPMKIIGSNDGVGVLTSNRAYAFGSYASGTTVSNSWYSQTLSGNVKDIIGSNGTFGVLTSSNVYAFGPYKSGTTISNSWYSQSLSGAPIKIVTSKGVIGVLTSTMAYAFGSFTSGTTVSNSWYSQSLSGTPIDIVAKNGKILVYTSTNVYSYGSYTSGTTTSNSWYSQSLSGTPIGVTN